MLVIHGMGSKIAQALIGLVDSQPIVPWIKRDATEPTPEVIEQGTRYLFCAGVLHGLRAKEHTDATLTESFRVNYIDVVRACEQIFERNPKARVCVVGSESGYSGSYDPAYAGAKAALHAYIVTRSLEPEQQLVGVAPSIIIDAGMTTRRKDKDRLFMREVTHPKSRFLRSIEVARMIYHLLYIDEGYTTGTVIRMNGGC